MNFRREIRAALREDRAWRDITSRALVSRRARARAVVKVREPGVIAGAHAAAEAFRLRDGRCRVRVLVPDGRPARRNQAVLEAEGPLASLLSAERTALNVLGHLSGIATQTHRFVRIAGPRGPEILDTRKTLPGLRALQKWAVRCGGGVSHRAHLAEAVLIKENHLALIHGERGLAALFRKIRALRRRGLEVEMECQNRKELLWGLFSGADILLLDNFPPRRLARVVRWIRRACVRYRLRRPLLEVSGGVTLKAMRTLARAGVDRVSIGRLTHSAPALDVAMDVHPLL